jgi:hypothetical protein
MEPLQAVVKNGRLMLDEPSNLPDGHVVLLIPLEELLRLADDAADQNTVAFTLAPAPAPRPRKKPKTVDATAILDELRSM